MSTGTADEVKIKLKHGDWEVEISCAENRVRQVVENVLSSLDTKIADPAVQSRLDSMQDQIEALKSRPSVFEMPPGGIGGGAPVEKIKGGMTCRSLLDSLWQEGYFSTERALGEVHEELGRRGYNYDRTAVSHSLADMVRETILTRTGTMRNFRYIQKRPAGGY
ncbi:MAG TPA: hypothetical protein VJP79_10555 [Nitrososphaera sp.]|nr:hypothetical protein [Nitrososphaera sp.]